MGCEKENDHTTDLNEKNSNKEQISTPIHSENNNLKGLCINCEKRHTCSISKPKEGVWRCDEYC
jgi:hypothetical protein